MFLTMIPAEDAFQEIVALVIAAAVVAFTCHRFKIVPIVGFLLTGILVGPHVLGIVEDHGLVESLAEIGVILLLFTIGVELSLDKLAKIKTYIFLGGAVQVLLSIGLVTLGLMGVGIRWQDSVFTGCLVALSSTAIVLKLLGERRESNSTAGQISLAVLIFQDLAVVAMAILVPQIGDGGGSLSLVVLSLLKAAGIIAAVLLVARRLMPIAIELAARTCSPEIFLISIIAICFGTTWLTSLAGLSLALGAFLAGLLVSESRFSHHALGEIMPLQILFSAAFFISVGSLLDVPYLFAHPFIVLGAVVAVLAVKIFAGTVSALALRQPPPVALWTGLLLAQVGEFSFVLQRSGADAGLSTAGMGANGSAAFIAASVTLMLITPILAGVGARVGARESLLNSSSAAEAPLKHVIINGLGERGWMVARLLKERSIPFTIITLDPIGAAQAELEGMKVVRGATYRLTALTQAKVEEAQLLLTLDDADSTTRDIVEMVNNAYPTLRQVVYVDDGELSEELKGKGVEVIKELGPITFEELVDSACHGAHCRVPKKSAAPLVDLCTHRNMITVSEPVSKGCDECIALGDSWVHLRMCCSCGKVGCCDSSKNKHASRHSKQVGHPIMQSIEEGEDWRWCYIDEMYV